MIAIYENGILIGKTELEKGDPSMGIRAGRLLPADGYRRIQPAIQELSYLLFERCITDSPSPKEIELRGIINSLQFKLTTDRGDCINISGIDIVDYSDDLGEEGIEITIIVDDFRTYEKFFDQ